MTTFAGKKWILFLTTGFFTLTSMAPDHVNFSGGWKLNESKTELTQQFPVCIFGKDRMRSKTMKIVSVDRRWKVYFYQGKFELNLWRKYYDARIR